MKKRQIMLSLIFLFLVLVVFSNDNNDNNTITSMGGVGVFKQGGRITGMMNEKNDESTDESTVVLVVLTEDLSDELLGDDDNRHEEYNHNIDRIYISQCWYIR